MATAKKARAARPAKKAGATRSAAKSPPAKSPRARNTKAAAVAASAPTLPAVAPGAKAAQDKPKRAKLVRDSFTMPKAEYAVIEQLKRRATALAHPAKKSELLRAGVKALNALSDAALLAALQAVPTIKTGRPKH